jgi:AcrR family transcriptional regulator
MPETRERPGGRTARVRAAVLEATLEILRVEGFAAITFDAVAKRSGIHRTTLHRRWPSRAALVADALAESSAQQVPVPDTGILRADLRAFARSVRGAIASKSSRGIASALADPAVAGELAQVTKRFWGSRFDAARLIVERAQARGELAASIDPVFVIELVGGPIWFRTLVVGRRADDGFLDRVIGTAIAGLTHGRSRSRG